MLKISEVILYLPLPRSVKMDWVGSYIDRKLKKIRVKNTDDRAMNERVELDKIMLAYLSEYGKLPQNDESLYTRQLIKKARRLRLPVPPVPTKVDSSLHEPIGDWQEGSEGLRWLTPAGIAKVREEIRKEEKWRREGRANWAVLVSATAGVIGTIIGLVAVLSK